MKLCCLCIEALWAIPALASSERDAAAVDAVGVVLDGAATVVPGVPGGAGTTIKVARGADKAVDMVRAANKTGDVLSGVDKATDAVKVAGDVPTKTPCSFVEGTTVVTPEGPVPIDAVRPGEVVLATAAPGRGSNDWRPVEDASPEGTCARLARLGRRAVLPALLAACAPADAATAPASALTQVDVYDTATSTWQAMPFGAVQVGDELHHAGHLLEATPHGLVDRGAVSLGQLSDAGRYWTVRTPLDVPGHGDWVLVLGDADGPHHAPLSEALEAGDRFVHGGHVFDSAWQDGEPVVRWSGDVLARATGRMVRTADGVFDLIIEGEAGRQTLEVTPEHPFWVAGSGWLWVEDLSAGDALRTLDGSVARVVRKAWRPGDVEVFNIAVEGAHTYFVGGWTPVLAHNCALTGTGGGGPPINRARQDAHTNGTPGKSQFNDDVDADDVTRTAWEQGTPEFRPDGSTKKVMEFDHPVGTTASGGHPVSSVEVHYSKKKGIHGVPSQKPQKNPEAVNPNRPGQ